MASSRTFRGLLKVIFIFTFIAAATLSLAGSVDDGIDILNFGKINVNYYRGGQPEEAGFLALKKLGVKTVIDFQERRRPQEAKWVEAAGMKFFKISLSSTRRPTAQQTEYFLKLVNDPANQPVFVHCAGGRHRNRVGDGNLSHHS